MAQAYNLLQILDTCLTLNLVNSIKLTVFYETTWSLWKAHNGSQYDDKISSCLNQGVTYAQRSPFPPTWKTEKTMTSNGYLRSLSLLESNPKISCSTPKTYGLNTPSAPNTYQVQINL